MNKRQAYDTGFSSVARPDARVLILGSMPGRKSLAETQYYAHPGNAFWPMMAALCVFDPALPYPLRLDKLLDSHIALWDVAHQCVRPGSLDKSIRNDSVVVNDFSAFLDQHPHISHIFFNGQKAAALYRQRVLKCLPAALQQIARLTLPSTSPAHASMNRAAKLDAWKIILRTLESVSDKPYLSTSQR